MGIPVPNYLLEQTIAFPPEMRTKDITKYMNLIVSRGGSILGIRMDGSNLIAKVIINTDPKAVSKQSDSITTKEADKATVEPVNESNPTLRSDGA